jgi:alanine racemase
MSIRAGTFLSIDLNALLHNISFFKSKLKENTKIVAVVKAFSYGHEANVIAKTLEKEGVDYFGVAYIQEGVSLRKAGIKTPILVFHPQVHDIHLCFDYQLQPSIYSFRMLYKIADLIIERNIENFKIHLKFNTGMNRLGFSSNDVLELINFIKEFSNIKIASIFSHLVASEDIEEKEFTRNQAQTFEKITSVFDKQISYPYLKHIVNSSGVLNYPEFHFDMVRVGIGLYGYANDLKWMHKLKNVAILQTSISQIHIIKKGESVSYNRQFIAKENTKSATIAIGYADGIPRRWSKGVGYFTVNGKKASILGNVCMDMVMIDVTNIECKEGDVVFVFENQETLENLALKTGSISYEILTDISIRVPRLVIIPD